MATEGQVTLPSDAANTGKQFRTQVGDTASAIPTGEHQEVVTLADDKGFLPTDSRMWPIPTAEGSSVLLEILHELKVLRLLLSLAHNIEINDKDVP